MRQAWNTRTPLAALAVLAATLTLTAVACTEDGPGAVAEPEADEPKTHLTAEEFAASLADGVMPDIDWVGWYRDGTSGDFFPLELRGVEEQRAESEAKGRRLPEGGYMPPGTYAMSMAEIDLHRARNLIIRHLQPPGCKFFPCQLGPHAEDLLEGVAGRLDLPYTRPPEMRESVEVIR